MRSKVHILETNSFGLFTACALYSNNKIPISLTKEASVKSIIDFLMKYLCSFLDKQFDTIHIFSAGCAAHLRSRCAFYMLKEIQKDVNSLNHKVAIK